jgi:hypothetical protein
VAGLNTCVSHVGGHAISGGSVAELAFAGIVCSNKTALRRSRQMTSDNEKNIPIEKQAIHKKPFHSPKLSSFGTVTQLTQSFENMMKDDGGSGMNSMVS